MLVNLMVILLSNEVCMVRQARSQDFANGGAQGQHFPIFTQTLLCPILAYIYMFQALRLKIKIVRNYHFSVYMLSYS